MQAIHTEIGHGLVSEPTTLLINPAQCASPGEAPGSLTSGAVRAINDANRLGHSINNMLIPVMMSVHQLALEGTNTEKGWQAFRDANQAIERIQHLVRSYMEPTRPHRLDLNQLVRDLVHHFERSTELRGIRMECHTIEAPTTVVASLASVYDALANLITNATDATPTGGIIKVRTGVDRPCGDEVDTQVTLEVADNGSGMTESCINQAFVSPFTTKPTGHGIGLACIATTMQAARGRIKVTSGVGLGTTIQLRFPTAPAA